MSYGSANSQRVAPKSRARNAAWRRHQRYVHGMRRLRQDRAEHGADTTCDCFNQDATHGRGAVFDRFADHPQTCSGPCCGNRRRWEGPSRQELRAAIGMYEDLA